jgi:glutamyl-Q tRNA(Asp) synthetase
VPELPAEGWTRFAPAPTGHLHLGHVANAIMVWGLARVTGRRVLLRIEDHDRQRCRPGFDEGVLEDLAWLGFEPDAGPVRQTDADAVEAYAAALDRMRAAGLTYGCTCTRATFATWAADHGRPWRGPGCPGSCRDRDRPPETIRVALGDGDETWDDLLLGVQQGPVTATADLVAVDRHGNVAYGFAVVVDDARQDIDLVIRGKDLRDATPGQIRLGQRLGRELPPRFAHHGLIRRSDGRKLSKSDGATGVRDLRVAGRAPDEVIGAAAAASGLLERPRPVPASAVAELLRGPSGA